MCHTVMKETDIQIENETAYISPIEWWAGISITMCSCHPEIEVNLLQLSWISKVVFK
jgi:hypothetical protein